MLRQPGPPGPGTTPCGAAAPSPWRRRAWAASLCGSALTKYLAGMALAVVAAHGACGTVHMTNSGATTWYAFAREIFAQANIRADLWPVAHDLNAPALRPPVR